MFERIARRTLPALLAFAALAALPAAAENGEHLTLPEAMERARSDTLQVEAARARLEASEARVDEAKGHRLPTVSLEETWLYTDGPAEVFGLQLSQERFSFPEFVAGDPNDPDFFDNALTRLEISVPVYTGGEISTRIRQAELGREAASRQADWTSDAAALAAAEGYVRLAQAREQVELLERSLETVRAHAERARAYVEQGMLVDFELLRAEVEVARLQDQLTRARGQARVAEAALSFRLDADPDTEWRLDPLTAPAPLEENLEAWLARVEGRADLQAAHHQVQAAELEAEVARAARRPRLGVAVQENFFDQWPLGTNGNHTAIVARASLEIFAGGRHKAAILAARAEARAAARELARAEEGARLQVRNAWVQARSALERHTTAEAALDAARETERITQARFEKGIVQMVDLLDATTARREARTRELVARADARLATLRLALEAGLDPESALNGPTAAGNGTPAADGAQPAPERTP